MFDDDDYDNDDYFNSTNQIFFEIQLTSTFNDFDSFKLIDDNLDDVVDVVVIDVDVDDVDIVVVFVDDDDNEPSPLSNSSSLLLLLYELSLFLFNRFKKRLLLFVVVIK